MNRFATGLILLSLVSVLSAAGAGPQPQPRQRIWSEAKTIYKNWADLEKELVGKKMLHQPIPMRDGVKLDANIYFPNTPPPYPVVLSRSPYLFEAAFWASPLYIALFENGYAFVHQNERGRYWSEGEFEYLAGAQNDGYDTVDWIAKQPWSNGKVGTFGCSSTAENQLRLSTAAHPAHAAAIALSPGAGIGRIGPYSEQGNHYRGGTLQLTHGPWFRESIYYGKYGDPRPEFPADLSQEDRERIAEYYRPIPNYMIIDPIRGTGKVENFDYDKYYRHLPVIELNTLNGPKTDWERFSRRVPGDPAWKEIQFGGEGDTYGTPTLWGFAWYDTVIAPNVTLYNYAREHTSTERAKGNQQMIIAPGAHCSFGAETKDTVLEERKVGDARYDYLARYMEWFDYWLKGEQNGALERPRVQYYQMGADRWVSADSFPIPGTHPVDLFLDSGGSANSLYGDGALRYQAPQKSISDGFVYDPLRPVQTLGGGACCMGTLTKQANGARDQSTLEMRSDVLVYTSAPLQQDLAVAGFIEVELYVSSDARDTDFTVKLLDVYPEGEAYNLNDSILRARYREGWDRQVFMERGKIYKLVFPPLITANTFKAGHRIRVDISSSNFPRFDRNLNTGGNNYDESKPVVARNRVHHSARYPSKIRLPITGELVQ